MVLVEYCFDFLFTNDPFISSLACATFVGFGRVCLLTSLLVASPPGAVLVYVRATVLARAAVEATHRAAMAFALLPCSVNATASTRAADNRTFQSAEKLGHECALFSQ